MEYKIQHVSRLYRVLWCRFGRCDVDEWSALDIFVSSFGVWRMPQILDESTIFRNCVAKALYDNIADSADELPFKKGDLLIVLEQNTGGLQGWWLCSFKGRQGICPGNRLLLMADVYGCCQNSKDACDADDFQRESRRLSWHAQSNRVQVSTFEIAKVDRCVCKCDPNVGASEEADSRYDVPRFGQPIPVRANGDLAVSCTPRRGASDGNVYDHVRQSQRQARNSAFVAYAFLTERNTLASGGGGGGDDDQKYDVPRPINSIAPASPTLSIGAAISSTRDSLFDSNRSGAISDYDHLPTPRLISTRQSQPPTFQQNDDEIASNIACYDVPLQVARELPLELRSAVKNLEQLQNEITGAIDTLLLYSAPLWRETDQLEPKLTDIKLAVLRLRSALHDLSEFGDGVLGNALNAPDKGLAQKLRPLTKALFETNKVVQECAKFLENCNWSVEVFARNPHPRSSAAPECNEIGCGPNWLDQLVICAQSLTEDVIRFSSFVQGNATLLFRRNSTDSDDCITNKQNETNEDEDYANFESHRTLNRTNSEVRGLLSHDMRKSFDSLIGVAEKGGAVVQLKSSIDIDQNDKQVLSFYATQSSAHLLNLTRAIDAFLNTVERNQPPKAFLAHGKFVILAAHRLVHIGDTVHQNVSCFEINAQVGRLSDSLSEALAAAVYEIKKAAVQFPSVVAVQEMINSVVNISHLARDLKMCLAIASQA